MAGPNWLSSLNLPYEEPSSSSLLETADDAEWMNSLEAWTTFDLNFAPVEGRQQSGAAGHSFKNQLEQQQHSEKIFENVFGSTALQHTPHAAAAAGPTSSYANLDTAIDGSHLVLDPAYQTLAPATAPEQGSQSQVGSDRAAESRPSSLDKKSASSNVAARQSQRSASKKSTQRPTTAAPSATVSPLDFAGEQQQRQQPPVASASGASPTDTIATALQTESASPASSIATTLASAPSSGPKPRGGQNKKLKLPKNAEQLDPEELANRIAMEEDKRRRNTAASGESFALAFCGVASARHQIFVGPII